MRVFKNKAFAKWAHKEGLSEKTLLGAVAEMEQGLIDADLGGGVYKSVSRRLRAKVVAVEP